MVCKGHEHRSQILELGCSRGHLQDCGLKATIQEGEEGSGRLPRETVINHNGEGEPW